MSNAAILIFSDLMITILVEMLVSWLLGVRSLADQLLILGMNGVTNPALHILISLAGSFALPLPAIYGITVVLEILVVLVEYIFLQRNICSQVGPLILSLAMNVASVAAGMVIARIFRLF